MKISVSEAKGQLTELVRRAEAGEDIVLTRHGQPALRLVPVGAMLKPDARRALLEAARRSGRANARSAKPASGGQDFLYGDDGLPV